MSNWKPVVGYENLYEVSDSGKIRSLDRFVNTKLVSCTKRKIKGRMLKQRMKPIGYYTVDLCKNGVVTNSFVHRIVAEAFIQNPDNKAVVNHINGDKTDNRVQNLEWVSYKENHWHARESGLLTEIGQHNSKRILCVETGMEFKSGVEAAKWVSEHAEKPIKASSTRYMAANIRRAATGGCPRAYGYHWKDI